MNLRMLTPIQEKTQCIKFMNNSGLYTCSINALFFKFFRDDKKEYLTRVWLIDPEEAESIVDEKRGQAWNGEYYASFGESEHRHWADAVKYGYISAGGQPWYRKTLDILEVDGRVWVNVPGRGYSGVGRVKEKTKPITEFMVRDGTGNMVPITQILDYLSSTDKPADQLEYFVEVEWIKTMPLSEAVREKGFFGNQNIVSRPKDSRWRHTIERLKTRWEIKE
ncbi:MAG: nuclease, partial [Planctomycetota bacterium]|jgi:hypothetical protein|nr:nuclease [Planctomycetota bacterium]